MYSFEQLRIFLAVHEAGSFSAAARNLGRAQSGISQAIANLEIDIGQELFDRSRSVPVLSPAGEALLPIARAILLQKQQFDQKVEALQRDEESELVIAIDESLLTDGLLDGIGTLNARHPITTFDIVSSSTFEVESMIRQGRAQLGVAYLSSDFKTDFDVTILGHSRFITVASPSHPLASNPGPVSTQQLESFRQLVYRDAQKRELWFSDRITASYSYANSHQALLALAQHGLGWTAVPEHLAHGALADGRLVRLTLDFEDDGIHVPIAALVSRSHRRGPVLEDALNTLKRPSAPNRFGFMNPNRTDIPDNFDRLHEDETIALFEGSST